MQASQRVAVADDAGDMMSHLRFSFDVASLNTTDTSVCNRRSQAGLPGRVPMTGLERARHSNKMSDGAGLANWAVRLPALR